MSDHDSRGKFQKGNQAGKGKRAPREMTLLKNETRQHVVDLAYSLTKPWTTLKQELKNPNATRLEFLLGHAISKHNHKFIKWVVEMAIGKPKQLIDLNEDEDQSELEFE